MAPNAVDTRAPLRLLAACVGGDSVHLLLLQARRGEEVVGEVVVGMALGRVGSHRFFLFFLRRLLHLQQLWRLLPSDDDDADECGDELAAVCCATSSCLCYNC
jgi:hypothetical protein